MSGMDAQEFSEFMGDVSALLGRELDESDVRAWDLVCGDLPYSLAHQALLQRVRSSSGFVSASAVRETASSLALERLRALEVSDLRAPSGLSPQEYRAWLGDVRDRLLRGETDTATIAAAARAAIGHGVAVPERTVAPPALPNLPRVIEHEE